MMDDKDSYRENEFGKHQLVSVVVAGKPCDVSRDLLIKGSSFFEVAMHPRQAGYVDCDSDTFPLPDVSLNNFEAMLEYFSSYEDEEKLKQTTAKHNMTPELFLLFSRLMVKFDYESIAVESLDLDNVFDFKEVAEATMSQKLKRSAEFLLFARFLDFRRTLSYRKLDLNELVDYLSSSNLVYNSEKEILEAIIWWLKYDMKKRAEFCQQLFLLVDWSKITRKQIEFVLNMKTIKRCPEFVATEISSAKLNLVNDADRKFQKRVQPPLKHLMVFGLIEKSNEEKCIVKPNTQDMPAFGFYNVETQKFSKHRLYAQDMETEGNCVAFHDGYLIFFGGIGGIRTSKWKMEITACNFYTKSWTTIGRLKTPRRHFKLVQDGDDFYMVGGTTKFRRPSQFFEKFNYKTKETTACAKILWKLPFQYECCVTKDHLCIFADNQENSIIYKYSIKKDLWTMELVDLPVLACPIGLAVPHKNSVYLAALTKYGRIMRREVRRVPGDEISFGKALLVEDSLREKDSYRSVYHFFAHDRTIYAYFTCYNANFKKAVKSFKIQTKETMSYSLDREFFGTHSIVKLSRDFHPDPVQTPQPFYNRLLSLIEENDENLLSGKHQLITSSIAVGAASVLKLVGQIQDPRFLQ